VIAAAAVLGLVARLGFAVFFWVDKPLTHDEREYLELAANLASGRGFEYDPLPPPSPGEIPVQRFGRAPGYPVFLAAVMSMASNTGRAQSTPLLVKLTQAIVGAAGVIIIGVLATHTWGPAAGATAALAAAVYPPLVWICAYALSEVLYSVLALGCALFLVRTVDRTLPGSTGTVQPMALVAGGALAGVTALVRPVMVLFVALYLLWLFFRRAPAHAVVFALGAAIVIAPWTLRSSERAGRLVLIATEGGVTFWTGNHPLARGDGDLSTNPELKNADTELRSRNLGLDADALEPVYYREAFNQIRAAPGKWCVLMAKKFFYQWIPLGPSYWSHSPLYTLTSIASYGLALPFGLAGLMRLVKERRVPVALVLLAASQVLAGLIFMPQERFRIPVIDPVLLILAAVWLVSQMGDAGRVDGSGIPVVST
jgi:hypothetical protein